MGHPKSKCINSVKKEEKIFTHFTGFNSYSDFKNVLEFVLPNLDRKRFVYWGAAQAKASFLIQRNCSTLQLRKIQLQI